MTLNSNEGEELVAQVDALLNTNNVFMHSNPVRSVRELLAATSNPNENRPSLEVARQFLSIEPTLDTAATAASTKPGVVTTPEVTESPYFAIKPNDDSTPIFQQN